MAETEMILQLRGIGKSFSGVQVLHDVHLDIRKGEVLGLVGENGAGKSTLMNIVAGVYRHDAGTMLLDGADYRPAGSLDSLEKGISFVHQELNVFNNLTVMENMFIKHFPKNRLGAIDYAAMKKRAAGVLARLDDRIRPDTLIDDLPMGQRQLAEIGKALEMRSRVIIFDEPTTSLSNKEKEKLFQVIGALVEQGTTVIYISHILEDVFRLCDRVVVLRDGQVTGDVPKAELRREEVIRLMVGRSLGALFPYSEKQVGAEALRVSGLNQGTRLKGVDLATREGEIVGLFGLMGAGRSELARAVFGVDGYDSGEVHVFGKRVEQATPGAMIRRGLAFITENRREEGLLMPKSVRENLSIVYLDRIKGKLMHLRAREEDRDTEEVIGELKIKTFNKNRQAVRTLSGGNQQKAVIGKWILTQPRIFIMDEPTKGVDVGAKHEIYLKMNELAANRSSILFISSETEELMGVCDRIFVMYMGRITGEISRESFSQDALLKMAFGGE